MVILGGGIGGLTVAHQLSKFPEYDISIYEAKSALGGLARSDREPIGECATEYCWRVFFGFYDNFLGVMSEIPVDDEKTSKDQLTVYKHINVANPISLRDQILGYSNILTGLTACDARLNEEDNITWWNALGSTSDSNLFREIGGWLGMDRFKGSYKSVIKVGIELQIIPSYLDPEYKDYVTIRPTSEAIFNPWERLLTSQNVDISYGSAVKDLTIENDKVISATIVTPRGVETITADYFVLNLPVDVLENVMTRSNVDPVRFGLSNITKLREGCLHMQLSFQLYFNRPVSLGDRNAFLLVESPWDLIILSYDEIYQTEICRNYPDIKGGWSVAACTAYTPGILYEKTMAECSEEEIKEELWAQLSRNKNLQDLIIKNNPFSLTKDIVVRWAPMWPTYDPAGGKKYADNPPSRTTEPKFTNNAGSYALRPSFRTYLSNTFISTGYIKETIDIYSMEAACIAGKTVANAVDGERTPMPTLRGRPGFLAPFRAIDSVCYSLGLPNVIALFVVLLFILLLAKTATARLR